MQKLLLNTTATLLVLTFFFNGARAQDIHFSQFHASPMNISPALTGSFDGIQRFSAIMRYQWYRVPVDYFSVSGAYEHRFLPRIGEKKGRFSGGLVFNHDMSGLSRLSLNGLGLSGAYGYDLSEQFTLNGGLMLSGYQRSFDLSNVRFENQYQPNDPGTFLAGPGETFDLDNRYYFSLSGGLDLEHHFDEPRNQLRAGFGAYHINRPNQSFFKGTDIPLPTRFSVYAMGTIKLTTRTDLLLQALRNFQGKYRETVFGVFGRWTLTNRPFNELALQAGGIFRWGDAASPAVALYYNNWEFGGMWDVNFSEFDVATDNNGGPEFYIRYIIKPRPVYCPTCTDYL